MEWDGVTKGWTFVEDKEDTAIALAYLSGQDTMAAVAEHFGVHYTSVSRLVKAREAAQRGGM